MLHGRRRKKKVIEQLNALITRLGVAKPQQSQPQPQSATPSQITQQPSEAQKINYAKVSAASASSIRGTSLKNLYNKVSHNGNDAPQQAQEPDAKQVTTQTESQPVNAEQLNLQWLNFAESVIKSDNELYLLLRSTKPRIEGSIINIEVTADQSQKILGSQELINYLRKYLHNSQLSINTTIKTETAETAELVYTPRQKLDKMVETNPEILNLIKMFDLDLEG
ncbi:MAG: hypothetical protein IKR17_10515 [Bacteroidales bacterium]|nr:hypothetical protein [Bacteroidales bacterium]